ncbi:RNA polymerase factor sigma-54 [uncultured Eubacterium sp.]|uniref:RNA polymerase factor sigma-54 n=1 Tax=Emergencia sp. TaxID=1926557 RepID=UPI000823240F|nr:RNA polymerase factor sigma-54 [uncultured Eubacterium sp.]
MKLGYELTIEQTQKLSMTPELIQAIQILQFNNQELVDYVQNELLENPVLEAEKEYDTQEVDIREKIREADYEEESFKQWEYSPDEDDDYTYEQYVSEEDTLTDYLFMQLQFSNLKGKHAAIGKYIIEAVDDNGYLTASVEEIAKAVDAEIEDVEDTLNFIQTFDPAGIAARNLRECLIIQLAAKGLLTDEIEYIIENMLEDLADNKIAHIAKTLNMKNQEVQQIADLIKTLEPKPGRLFSSGETTRYVIPDIFVEKINDEFVVTNNDTSVPKLMVSSYYNKLSAEADKDEELNKYLNDRFNAAVWLIKSIEQRKQTIYNVASAVVKYQQDFFDKGEKYLKTLTLKQIAEEVGVHESTVSRSINGKYMQSPRGVFELKYFFSSGVSGGDGAGVSSNSVKSIIKEIINGEDPRKPYSDQDMVEILKDKGIDISRRTVAKYREGMNILSSSKRRRF